MRLFKRDGTLAERIATAAMRGSIVAFDGLSALQAGGAPLLGATERERWAALVQLTAFYLNDADRMVFFSRGSDVRDDLIEQATIVCSERLVEESWLGIGRHQREQLVDLATGLLTEEQDMLSTCKTLFYDNALMRIDDTSGLWVILRSLTGSDKLPDFWDWRWFVANMVDGLAATRLNDVLAPPGPKSGW